MYRNPVCLNCSALERRPRRIGQHNSPIRNQQLKDEFNNSAPMRDRKVNACMRLAPILLLVASVSGFAADKEKATPKGVSVVNYRGWADSYLLSNGTVEAVVVPAVGRVMQFHFIGEDDVFWENSALQGKRRRN